MSRSLAPAEYDRLAAVHAGRGHDDVQAVDRAAGVAPGAAAAAREDRVGAEGSASTTCIGPGRPAGQRMIGRGLVLGAVLSVALANVYATGAERSRVLRAEFMRLNPCPSTGLPCGACPGWQVDHALR